MLEWIFDHPRPLFVLLFVVFLATVEIGFRWRLRRAALDDVQHDGVKGTRSEISVLLSLLMGFTLAMSLLRYDQRTELVADEANAIGTARLRVEMLPEPARGRVRELMRQYVSSRVQYSRAGSLAERQLPLLQSQQIQGELWREATTVAQQAPTPVTSLFVAALNESFDLRDKRVAANENRVPGSIWFMLIGIALMTCFTIGYGHGRRLWYSMAVPPLMVAIVMMLIADLDSPRTGLIRVRQHSIERLQSETGK